MAEPFTLLARVGITEYLFPFLLVFALLYAVLSKTKMIGDKADLNAIIAMVVAFLSVLSTPFRLFVLAFVPYAAVIFVLLFLGIFMYAIFGANEKEISSLLTHSTFYYPILIVFIIIVFVVMGDVGLFRGGYQQYQNGVPANGEIVGPSAMNVILGSPLVLGMIVMLTLMAVAIYMIVKPPKKKD